MAKNLTTENIQTLKKIFAPKGSSSNAKAEPLVSVLMTFLDTNGTDSGADGTNLCDLKFYCTKETWSATIPSSVDYSGFLDYFKGLGAVQQGVLITTLMSDYWNGKIVPTPYLKKSTGTDKPLCFLREVDYMTYGTTIIAPSWGNDISSFPNPADRTEVQYHTSSTIAIVKEVEGAVVGYNVAQQSSSSSQISTLIMNTTYANLLNMVNQGELVAGMRYRITDYETIVNEMLTYGQMRIPYIHSAGHNFDIIVEAISENELDKNARVARHSGDGYFINNDLSAWTIKYDINNDATKYYWASSNGKGVIYYMKDEFGNECPYDFKNIMFVVYDANSDSNTANIIQLKAEYIESGSFADLHHISNRVNVYDHECACANTMDVFYCFLMYYMSVSDAEAEGNDTSQIQISNVLFTCTDKNGQSTTYPHTLRATPESILSVGSYETITQEYLNSLKAKLVYTFSVYKPYNTNNSTYVIADHSLYPLCQNNKISQVYTKSAFLGFGLEVDVSEYQMFLPNNVFISNFSVDKKISYSSILAKEVVCSNNSIGENSCFNVFGFCATNNSLGKNCFLNRFLNECYDIKVGDNASTNWLNARKITIGSNFKQNIIAVYGDGYTEYMRSVVGDHCEGNLIKAYYISLGNSCEKNEFLCDSSYDSVELGDDCYNNKAYFPYKVSDIKFGKECKYNYLTSSRTTYAVIELGDGCQNNNFGDSSKNIHALMTVKFGRGCSNNNMYGHIGTVELGNGCSGNSFSSFKTTSDYSYYSTNSAVNYNAGDDCDGNTIAVTFDSVSDYAGISVNTGKKCSNINIRGNCIRTSINIEDYCSNITISNGLSYAENLYIKSNVSYISLSRSGTGASNSKIKNYIIDSGFYGLIISGSGTTTYKFGTITLQPNREYTTVVIPSDRTSATATKPTA